MRIAGECSIGPLPRGSAQPVRLHPPPGVQHRYKAELILEAVQVTSNLVQLTGKKAGK